MAYLTLGEEFYKFNRNLFDNVLATLENVKLVESNSQIMVLQFDSEVFKKDEFCIALIKNERRTRLPYLFKIIKADLFNRHLSK